MNRSSAFGPILRLRFSTFPNINPGNHMAKNKKKKQQEKAKKNGVATKTKPDKPAKAAVKAALKSSWFDEESQKPVIEKYARKLGTFMETMADGQVDAGEVESQEKRLVKAMKEVEAELSPSVHAKVTRLLWELTAYDIMQVFHAMQEAMPKTAFHG